MIDKYVILESEIEKYMIELCETWIEKKGILRENEYIRFKDCLYKNGRIKKTKLDEREKYIRLALKVFNELIITVKFNRSLYKRRDYDTKHAGCLLVWTLFNEGGIVNGQEFISEIKTYNSKPINIQQFFTKKFVEVLDNHNIIITDEILEMINDIIITLYKYDDSIGGKGVGKGEFLFMALVNEAVKSSIGDIKVLDNNLEIKAGLYRITPESLYSDGYQGINKKLSKEFPQYFQSNDFDVINSYDDYNKLSIDAKNRWFELFCNSYHATNYSVIKDILDNNNELWFIDYNNKVFIDEESFHRLYHIIPNIIYANEQKFDLFMDMNIIDGNVYTMCLTYHESIDVNIQDNKYRRFIKKVGKMSTGRARIAQYSLQK